MANTYDVAPSDVSNELPGLHAGGFPVADAPVTLAMVTTFIATADTMVTLYIEKLTGIAPLLSDSAAPIAKRFILNWVIAQVIRVDYTGQDAAATLSAPYAGDADALWNLLTTLGGEDVGTVLPSLPGAGAYPVVQSFRVGTFAPDEYGRVPQFDIGSLN